jgi:cytochrome c-type biogenesis protein CcmH
VEDSPTELARQMRAVVREQLAAGRSPDDVRAYFVDKYGEWILLQPKASGFNLLVYVLPWLAVLAGMTVIVLAVRRWTRPLPAEASAATRAPASTFES